MPNSWFKCRPFYPYFYLPLVPIKSVILRFKMVVPPYVHPFLLQLCDVWPLGRPPIRSSGLDVRRFPLFWPFLVVVYSLDLLNQADVRMTCGGTYKHFFSACGGWPACDTWTRCLSNWLRFATPSKRGKKA